MEASKNQDASLPQLVLGDVYWTFRGPTFASREELERAVCARQAENGADQEARWQPEAVAIPRSRIILGYKAPDDSGDLEERFVELCTDGGGPFTAGELLFKVHNAVAPSVRKARHVYLEGLVLHTPSAACRFWPMPSKRPAATTRTSCATAAGKESTYSAAGFWTWCGNGRPQRLAHGGRPEPA